jgi:hypothetical protein
LEPGESFVLADLPGPGKVTSITVIIDRVPGIGRSMMMRAFWDDEPSPSVESPVADFFGLGHGELFYPINNAFFSVKHQTGYSCYFPMPFARSARFEVVNTGSEGAGFFFFLDWDQYDEPLVEELRFHAKWRREFPAPAYAEDYEIVDVLGRGRFLGYSYSVRQHDTTERWSHAGAERIYIDGRTANPALIRGLGGEDAFGVGFGGVIHQPESHLYSGMPLFTYDDPGAPQPFVRMNGYRFYVAENYSFDDSFHMRFGSIANDISSVAYWYQAEPHHEFFTLPAPTDWIPGEPIDGPTQRIENPREDTWLLLGPFPDTDIDRVSQIEPDTDQTFDVDWPEGSIWTTGVEPDHPQTRPHWLTWRTTGGFVEFSNAFRPHLYPGIGPITDVAATAYRTLHVDTARRARLTVGFDDRMLIRVNGGPAIDLGEHDYFRTTQIEVDLVAGDNLLQCTLTNTAGKTWGAWAFAVHIDEHSGE